MVRVDHRPRHTDGQRVVELSLDRKIHRCLVLCWLVDIGDPTHGSGNGSPGCPCAAGRLGGTPGDQSEYKIAPKVQPGSSEIERERCQSERRDPIGLAAAAIP